jgi:hypothetical protein
MKVATGRTRKIRLLRSTLARHMRPAQGPQFEHRYSTRSHVTNTHGVAYDYYQQIRPSIINVMSRKQMQITD